MRLYNILAALTDKSVTIKTGTIATNIPADSYVEYPISYTGFSQPPVVIPVFESTSTAGAFGLCSVSVNNVTATGANIRCANGGTGNRAPNVTWIAIGR